MKNINWTDDPSPMRKRLENALREEKEQKQRERYRAQLLPWSAFWEADCPGA